MHVHTTNYANYVVRDHACINVRLESLKWRGSEVGTARWVDKRSAEGGGGGHDQTRDDDLTRILADDLTRILADDPSAAW